MIELIELIAEDGMWYTKTPSTEWNRYFWNRVKVPKSEVSNFELVTDAYKVKYESDRVNHFNQLTEEED